jgi:ubiquitin C-terminal hydrolase
MNQIQGSSLYQMAQAQTAGSKKINQYIDFPIERLNMQPYSIDQGNIPVYYDLYAVSYHYGSLEGGHYTASCYNPQTR